MHPAQEFYEANLEIKDLERRQLDLTNEMDRAKTKRGAAEIKLKDKVGNNIPEKIFSVANGIVVLVTKTQVKVMDMEKTDVQS